MSLVSWNSTQIRGATQVALSSLLAIAFLVLNVAEPQIPLLLESCRDGKAESRGKPINDSEEKSGCEEATHELASSRHIFRHRLNPRYGILLNLGDPCHQRTSRNHFQSNISINAKLNGIGANLRC